MFYTCDFSYTISLSSLATKKGPGLSDEQKSSNIYVGLGANIPSPAGSPRETLEAAIGQLRSADVAVLQQSPWYRSPAFPDPSEPEFVNGVIEIGTKLKSSEFLVRLHQVERDFGRIRERKWEPRTLDLDLLDFAGELRSAAEGDGLNLPHPRMADRDWVLLPLRDVAADWHHPRSGKSIDELIQALPRPLTAQALV